LPNRLFVLFCPPIELPLVHSTCACRHKAVSIPLVPPSA
jgi:hypothetical protein